MISQRQLELAIALRNQIDTLTRLYEREVSTILLQLLDGCAIEHGSHWAELLQEVEPAAHTRRLVINGRRA